MMGALGLAVVGTPAGEAVSLLHKFMFNAVMQPTTLRIGTYDRGHK